MPVEFEPKMPINARVINAAVRNGWVVIKPPGGITATTVPPD
jgi:hypothetical protein